MITFRLSKEIPTTGTSLQITLEENGSYNIAGTIKTREEIEELKLKSLLVKHRFDFIQKQEKTLGEEVLWMDFSPSNLLRELLLC